MLSRSPSRIAATSTGSMPTGLGSVFPTRKLPNSVPKPVPSHPPTFGSDRQEGPKTGAGPGRRAGRAPRRPAAMAWSSITPPSVWTPWSPRRPAARLDVLVDRLSAASMGPRLGSRGKGTFPPYRRLSARQLQWGRDLVVAEKSKIRWRGWVVPRASMGPRLGSRGKNHLRLQTRAAREASMGPRLGSRGKRRRRAPQPSASVASMGPRLGSRGKFEFVP